MEMPEEDIPLDEGEIDAPLEGEMVEHVGEGEVRAYEEVKLAQRQKLEQVRSKAPLSVSGPGEPTSLERRLDFLRAQSDVFSRFISGSSFDDETAAGGARSKAGGRSRMSEDAEDKQLLKAAQSKAVVTRLLKQPDLVTGNMRAYQLEGLNWLIRLHDNYCNGILADEVSFTALAYLHLPVCLSAVEAYLHSHPRPPLF